MKSMSAPLPLKHLAALSLGVLVGAAVVAALAGWMLYGTSILFTYAQDGLAWCF
jgi:hypothetical protein